jgi:hypothetical protein
MDKVIFLGGTFQYAGATLCHGTAGTFVWRDDSTAGRVSRYFPNVEDAVRVWHGLNKGTV